MAQPRPQQVAAVILMALSGKVLMMRRTDTGQWAFPAGSLKAGETPEECAWRETWEETGFRCGSVGKQLMRRVKDDGDGVVDCVTFVCPVEAEFAPTMNHEHSDFAWLKPEDVVKAAKNAGPDPTDPDAQFLADLEGSA
jgi:8-oxo-dGTP pyrophosphatase MutT (NUDIX family)